MKTELTCITCPLGCALSVEREGDGPLSVSGNRCPRGIRYANEELLSPKRVLTATVRVVRDLSSPAAAIPASDDAPSRLPVRTSAACPKESLGELLAELYALELRLPVKRGDALIKNWRGTGVDVLAARSLS